MSSSTNKRMTMMMNTAGMHDTVMSVGKRRITMIMMMMDGGR